MPLAFTQEDFLVTQYYLRIQFMTFPNKKHNFIVRLREVLEKHFKEKCELNTIEKNERVTGNV